MFDLDIFIFDEYTQCVHPKEITMLEINVKEARCNLSSILDRVEKGEEIIITRRGKRVARISNIENIPTPLQSLKQFRNKISIKGKSLSQIVINQREEERY